MGRPAFGGRASARDTAVPVHLDAQQLADRWRISAKTLANWRAGGRGPTYIKIGGRVVYRLGDIQAVEMAGVHVVLPLNPS